MARPSSFLRRPTVPSWPCERAFKVFEEERGCCRENMSWADGLRQEFMVLWVHQVFSSLVEAASSLSSAVFPLWHGDIELRVRTNAAFLSLGSRWAGDE